LDAALIRARLAGPPPADVAMPAGAPGARALAGTAPVPAAVLVPIVGGAMPGVLLTKRAAHLRRHAGQVSFPGGRIDAADAGAEAAALREAWEEIGLAREEVEVVGRMSDYVTGTGFIVTPVIGLIAPGFVPVPAADEVDAIFQLDLAVLLDPAAPRRRRVKLGEAWREYWVWPHPDHEIWGATAAILVGLAALLRRDK
jgi:8-oxo-dGTP pyrophosphatase MutT (NUDIX family)